MGIQRWGHRFFFPPLEYSSMQVISVHTPDQWVAVMHPLLFEEEEEKENKKNPLPDGECRKPSQTHSAGFSPRHGNLNNSERNKV